MKVLIELDKEEIIEQIIEEEGLKSADEVEDYMIFSNISSTLGVYYQNYDVLEIDEETNNG